MTEPERQCIRRRTAELIRQYSPDVAGRIEVVTALMEEFGITANSALGWWQKTKGRQESQDDNSRYW